MNIGPFVLLIFFVLFIIASRNIATWGDQMIRILIACFLLFSSTGGFYNVVIQNPQNPLAFKVFMTFFMLVCILLALGMIFPSFAESVANLTSGKCRVCGQKANDVLTIDGHKKEPYCRNHLIQKFNDTFTQFTYPMVVFHPEQDRKFCQTMYPYYALNEMEKKFLFSKPAVGKIVQTIETVTGQCRKCNKRNASVAYFNKGLLPWNSGGPLIEKVTAEPKLLCYECALDYISPDLRQNKKNFDDGGLFAPYKAEGVYVNTFL